MQSVSKLSKPLELTYLFAHRAKKKSGVLKHPQHLKSHRTRDKPTELIRFRYPNFLFANLSVLKVKESEMYKRS